MRKLYSRHKEKINYLFTGIWNTVFGYLVFVCLYYLFGHAINYFILMVISTIISITNAYISYKFFVFKTKGDYLAEYLRFYIIYGASFLLNAAALPLMVEAFNINPVPAQAIVIPIVVIVSYFGHKHFSFRKVF